MVLIIILISLTLCHCQIIISEVMFNPSGGDSPNEFVELYNISADPVDLTNWLISDEAYSDGLEGNSFLLPPNSYAVIFENDYVDDEGSLYYDLLPPGIQLFYVDDASIGNGLKNSGDSVYLIDALGDTLSSVSWLGGEDGYSLERVVADYPEVPLNWRQSLDLNGTPGFENSVSSFRIDVALDSAAHVPQFPVAQQEFTLSVYLENNGLFEITGALKMNGILMDSVFLPMGLSTQREYQVNGSLPGVVPYLLTISANTDYNTANDSLWHEVRIKSNYRSLLINEIQYSPLSGEPEWVELVNVMSESTDLYRWQIADDENSDTDIADHFILEPGAYCVVSGDSSLTDALYFARFPGLNNSGDDIFLFDPCHRLIDHVQYDPNWGGGQGYSLERITWYIDSNDPANWGSSAASGGSTPGGVNSLYVPDLEARTAVSLSPNPFSPDADGFEDELTIAYHLPFTEATLLADIYDVRGRKMITLAAGIHTGMEGILRWDGKNDSGRKCRVGQYLLVVEASNAYSGKSFRDVERIILAKKLN